MKVIITSLSDVTVDGGPSLELVTHASHAKTSDDRSALHVAALEYEAKFLAAAEKATAILAKAQEALTADDLETVKALLQPAVDEAKQTERERRLAELDKQIAELQRQRDEASRAEAVDAAAVITP